MRQKSLVSDDNIFSLLLFIFVVINIISFMKFEISYLYAMKFASFIVLFMFMFLQLIKQKKKIIVNTKIIILFSVWFCIMILGLYQSEAILSDLFNVISYLLLFAYTFILVPTILDKDSYPRYVKVFFWAICFCSVLSVVLSLGDPEAFHTSPINLRKRYSGYFIHPNALSLFTYLGIVTSVMIYYLTKNMIYLIVALAYGYTIYLSDSRTALFSLGLFFIFIVYLNVLKDYRLRIAVTFFATFVTILSVWEFAKKITVDFDTLLSNRLTIWKDFYTLLLNQKGLLLGLGMKGVEGSVDNYYVQILLKTGIMGLSVYLLIVFYVLYTLWKNHKHNDSIRRVIIVFATVSFIYAFTESFLFSLGNVVSVFLWSSIGIFTLSNTRPKEKLVALSISN